MLWVSHEAPDVQGQGGQRRQYRQIQALHEAGHLVIVVVPSSRQSTDRLEGKARVVRTPRPRHGTTLLAQLTILLLTAVWRPHAVVVAHAESWDLVALARHATRSLIVDFHNVNSRWYRRLGDAGQADHWEAVERTIAAAAWAVTVCSEQEAAALEEALPRRRPVVAPNGVAADEWSSRIVHLERDPVVGTFGSWWYGPNREGLLWFVEQVWPQVLAAVPRATLAVAGGHEAAELLRGVPSACSRGRVADLAAFADEAALLVVPVQGGPGTPLKFGEALASGAPVVATSHAASSYGRADVCVVADDPLAFAAACVDLLLDPLGAQRLGDEGRRFALGEMEWRRTTRPLQGLIEARVGRRHRRRDTSGEPAGRPGPG